MDVSTRVAGALLGLSALLWIAMIAAWPIFIGSRDIGSADEAALVMDRAAHLLEKQSAFRLIWIVESLGAIGMAVAGLILMHRQATKDGLAPLGWAAIGVGSTVYVAMYGVMLGAYWPAAASAEFNPAVLASAITGAMALFFLSNIALNLGFSFAFLAEARSHSPAVPRWVSWLGVIVSALALAASLMGLVAQPKVSALGSVDAAALIAALHFALIAALGFGICRLPKP